MLFAYSGKETSNILQKTVTGFNVGTSQAVNMQQTFNLTMLLLEEFLITVLNCRHLQRLLVKDTSMFVSLNAEEIFFDATEWST